MVADLLALLEQEESDLIAGALIQLSKDVDMRAPALNTYLKAIAAKIKSPLPSMRHAAVFALCYHRPVPGFERVAVSGWEAAPAYDLHWHSSAIENCYNDSSMVSFDAVIPVINRIVTVGQSVASSEQSNCEGATEDARIIRNEGLRVLKHFFSLMSNRNDWKLSSDLLCAEDLGFIVELLYCLACRTHRAGPQARV